MGQYGHPKGIIFWINIDSLCLLLNPAEPSGHTQSLHAKENMKIHQKFFSCFPPILEFGWTLTKTIIHQQSKEKKRLNPNKDMM